MAFAPRDESMQRKMTDGEHVTEAARLLAAERRSRALVSLACLMLGAVVGAVGATLMFGIGAGAVLFGIMTFIVGVLMGRDS